MGTSLPSTNTRKLAAGRPRTRLPRASVTTASTLTTRTSIDPPKAGGYGCLTRDAAAGEAIHLRIAAEQVHVFAKDGRAL